MPIELFDNLNSCGRLSTANPAKVVTFRKKTNSGVHWFWRSQSSWQWPSGNGAWQTGEQEARPENPHVMSWAANCTPCRHRKSTYSNIFASWEERIPKRQICAQFSVNLSWVCSTWVELGGSSAPAASLFFLGILAAAKYLHRRRHCQKEDTSVAGASDQPLLLLKQCPIILRKRGSAECWPHVVIWSVKMSWLPASCQNLS